MPSCAETFIAVLAGLQIVFVIVLSCVYFGTYFSANTYVVTLAPNILTPVGVYAAIVFQIVSRKDLFGFSNLLAGVFLAFALWFLGQELAWYTPTFSEQQWYNGTDPVFNYRNVSTHVVPPDTIQQVQLAFFYLLIVMTLCLCLVQIMVMLVTICSVESLKFASVSDGYAKPKPIASAETQPLMYNGNNQLKERSYWWGCYVAYNSPMDLCNSCTDLARGHFDSFRLLEFSRISLALIGLICALVEIAATAYCITANIPPLPGLDGVNAVSYIGFALAFYPLHNPSEQGRSEQDVLSDLKLSYKESELNWKTRSHYTLFAPYITAIVLCIGVVFSWMGVQNQMQNDPAYISLPSVTGTYHIQQSNITLFGTDQAGFNFVTTHYKVTTLLSSILATLCLASLVTILIRANCSNPSNWKATGGISGFKSN